VSLELLLSCYLRLVCLVALQCNLCLLRLIDLPFDCDCDSASEIRRYRHGGRPWDAVRSHGSRMSIISVCVEDHADIETICSGP
jgi:hypothetical protein